MAVGVGVSQTIGLNVSDLAMYWGGDSSSGFLGKGLSGLSGVGVG